MTVGDKWGNHVSTTLPSQNCYDSMSPPCACLVCTQVDLPPHLVWSKRTDKTETLKTSMHAGGASLPFRIGCRTASARAQVMHSSVCSQRCHVTVQRTDDIMPAALRHGSCCPACLVPWYACPTSEPTLHELSCVPKFDSLAAFGHGPYRALPL